MSWWTGKEMIKAYEKNRAQLNKRKSLKENLETNYSDSKSLKFKKVSSQELETIKSKFLKKRKKENKKNVIILITILGIMVVLVFLLF